MHKYLQQYLTDAPDSIIKTSNSYLAESLAQIVIDNLIIKLDQIWGSEVSVYYMDKYAGTIDLIGIYDGKICVIDYKSSYKNSVMGLFKSRENAIKFLQESFEKKKLDRKEIIIGEKEGDYYLVTPYYKKG